MKTIEHKPAPYTCDTIGGIHKDEPGKGIPLRYKVKSVSCSNRDLKWKCVAQQPYVETDHAYLYHKTQADAIDYIRRHGHIYVVENNYQLTPA